MTRKRKVIKELENPSKSEVFKRKELRPKTAGQQEFLDAICENQITICLGPAGTGKGHVSIGYAVQHLISKQCKKIILSRPIIPGGGEDMGHLPGTADDKISPYLQPLLDELRKFASAPEIQAWKNDKIIEFIPLAHTRGRTFDDAVIIYDELQNANKQQIKMVLTRLGQNSKMLLLGDIEQSDLHTRLQGALQDCFDKLNGEPGIGTVQLTEKDVVRNELIVRILRRLKD